MVFFHFIQILIEHSVSRQRRPSSDSAFYGVSSVFTLFAFVPEEGRRADIG